MCHRIGSLTETRGRIHHKLAADGSVALTSSLVERFAEEANGKLPAELAPYRCSEADRRTRDHQQLIGRLDRCPLRGVTAFTFGHYIRMVEFHQPLVRPSNFRKRHIVVLAKLSARVSHASSLFSRHTFW